MNRTQLMLVAAVATCAIGSEPARAQFVVSDVVVEAQTAATAVSTAANLQKTIAVAANTAANLEQTMAMVSMLTTPFGITGLLSALNQPNQYPSTNQLERQMFSTPMPTAGTASAIASGANRNVKGNDAEGTLLRDHIAGSANAAGLAANNLKAMDYRLTENASTPNQLSRSGNIMQATVTNGLVLKQIHDAAIQNVQATSLLTMTTAQAGLHRAEEAIAQRREHQATADIFGP
ncbi:type IV secretion system protein VirB5 [Bradyrhizobium sp. CCGUVB23]|uniref:type IV secretion system protein VirB5 n=1 Tax=Bradyrhizobium sp. CCGUVB23 TaxID=2949630 RepID=UPI0020B43EDE|nr:type IV secretion system protein VirB5 [Bradyrhizobium sp. CCGUVB23]MCP3468665.1 type IV secretion system protein VirB5 [Bradyrhizobium sp. CCGUVB23]